MNQSPQGGWERALRKALWWIIGLFVFLAFVPFVGMTLFEGFKRGPLPWREMLPGCALMFGPVLLWISLAAMYFRAPKELRTIYFGDFGDRGGFSGRYNVGGIIRFFSGYRKHFGMDVWFIALLISIVWSVILVIAFVFQSSRGAPAR